MNMSLFLLVLVIMVVTLFQAQAQAQTLKDYQFGPFNQSYYATFAVLTPATISNGALQVTPDSAGNFTLQNRSGRIFYNHSFTLWTTQNISHPTTSSSANNSSKYVASFNSSFLVNVFRVNGSATPGEGLAFVIAPSLDLPAGSDGQYLGLTNATTDGNATNRLVAVELDTLKESFDPDGNHVGIDVNSVRSVKTASLANHSIEIAPAGTTFHVVWVEYDGAARAMRVYMAEQPQEADGTFVIRPRPSTPVITAEELDLGEVAAQRSYFGFAASTGSSVQLNCVLRWNLTVELLQEEEEGGGGGGGGSKMGLVIGLSAGAAAVVAVAIAGLGVWYAWRRRRAAAEDTAILGALKSLPGTPREFKYRELKKATSEFDEKHNKLGEGGFGIVYKGWLSSEKMEIAVKKFSRDNLKGKDDFLAELTIINRLRHKHLVRLLGWCHKNRTLLLVYEYMPNGSLDNHLFCGPEKAALSWELRYKIVSGVSSALHYLHNEYDQKVIHRDLKASNILLDAHFNARLGDFGLARAIENERTSYAELEGIPGTMGYIAPECFHTGKATRESDVYGFGAVILEVVCGQRPWTKRDNFQFLVDWVWWLHREGCILKAVDERLGCDYTEEEAERLLLLGLACSHPNAAERPTTQAIVQIISGSVAPPHVPPFKPSFVWPSAMPEGLAIGLDSSDSNINSMATSITTGSSWRVGISEP